MAFTRRLSTLVAAGASGLVAFAGNGVADELPAGNYQITTVSAFASFFDPDTYEFASIFVDATITTSRTGTNAVVMASANWSAGGGCSILANPSDFTYSSDLSTAALHTTFTDDLQPCDSFQSLVPPTTVDATWAGSAASGAGRNNRQYACGGYRSETMTVSSHNNVTATFTIASQTFNDPQGSLSLSDQQVHAQGVLPPTCIQLSGKGAGPGPQAPGSYDFSSLSASFGSGDASDPTLSLSANQFTNVFNPNGQAASTTKETDLRVFVSGSLGSGFACFVISPSDYTISGDLSSASLHIEISPDTPRCEPSFGDLPFSSATLGMTLTGTGPIATIRSDTAQGCFKTFFLDRLNPAAGNATLTVPMPGEPDMVFTFTAAFAEIDSSDHQFEVLGSTPCAQG